MGLIPLQTSLPLAYVFVGVVLLDGCHAASRDSTESLLTKYKAATCINPRKVDRATRIWNAEITMMNGSKVAIEAASMVGGLVTVTYLASGERLVAANAGDYVYPYDIRINNQHDRLYIVASGLAGGIWQRTVLFEYDLKVRRQTARHGVKDKDLPTACSEESNR
jgi:hypothetical protein